MIRTHEDHLAHYGILRRSGRYPWGSGASESTRNRSFLDTVDKLRKEGMSDAEIAKGFDITTTQLRAARSIALAQQKQEKILTAQRLKDKGWSNVAIGERMGINESSVRALLAPGEKDKADALQATAKMLKDQVHKKNYIQVGSGVESQLGITQTRLNTALAVLQEQGYTVHNIKVQQLGTGKYTTMKVLAKPGVTLSEVQKNRSQIRLIDERSEDGGRSFLGFQPPISISSRRIGVNYDSKEDGVIYIRPGVKDLHMGGNRYGQVRIAVDGTHYLKGMAVYKDDLPTGKDIVFNTKQPRTKSKKDVMKEMSKDPELPFGALVNQIHGPDGKVSSALNMVGIKEGAGAEGDWDTWSRTLSSQVLSKQSPALAKGQLNLTYERRRREFDEISSLTNPTVRKQLLMRFGDSTDAAAVHLKAASLPRQTTKVLLPVRSMRENEIYAPSMRDGEMVALVRYPHAGKFEIPQLKVNNRNPEARKLLGTAAKDAVGINHKVAQQLSGADFDGDTVLVIPNNKRKLQTEDPLNELKNFDPMVYKLSKDSPTPRISPSRKQQEMGKVSNLITDMSLHGASNSELARAVKHSMVVIDAEKHGLDFIQSEKDHGIQNLKEKYQGGKRKGASTLISKAGAKVYVPHREERPARLGGKVDPETGKKVYVKTGRMIPERKRKVDPETGKVSYVDTGRMIPKRIRSQRLAEAEDAFSLIEGREPTIMESLYAEHSNKLKALANDARKAAVHTQHNPYSPSARKTYAPQVKSLNAKLNLAKRNAPLEKQAQLLANAKVSLRRQANPHMEPEEVTKIKQHELNEARIRTGAKKHKIILTQDEWDAIQAGAISTHRLEEILTNSDMDSVRQLALPKPKRLMTSAKKARATQMLASGYTQAEVADALGVSLTTLKVGLGA